MRKACFQPENSDENRLFLNIGGGAGTRFSFIFMKAWTIPSPDLSGEGIYGRFTSILVLP
jgi:hypothetical protein